MSVTKINMLSTQACKIRLPPGTKVVKDICILCGGSALYASLGRRLSLFSMASDSVVLQCHLQAPPWSFQQIIMVHMTFMLACRMPCFWSLILVRLQDPCILWPGYLLIWFIRSTQSWITAVPERLFLLLLLDLACGIPMAMKAGQSCYWMKITNASASLLIFEIVSLFFLIILWLVLT